jgi:hypothetical protein
MSNLSAKASAAYSSRRSELEVEVRMASNKAIRNVIFHALCITDVCMWTLAEVIDSLAAESRKIQRQAEELARSAESVGHARTPLGSSQANAERRRAVLAQRQMLKAQASFGKLQFEITTDSLPRILHTQLDILIGTYVHILENDDTDLITAVTEVAKVLLGGAPFIGLVASAFFLVVDGIERRANNIIEVSKYLDSYDRYIRACHTWALLAEHLGQIYSGAELPKDHEEALQLAADVLIARLANAADGNAALIHT